MAALVDHGIGTVYSTDGAARISVEQAFNIELGDCLTLRWMNEQNNPKRIWYCAHFSPARACLIARELIAKVVVLEKQNGVKPIDPIPEK